MPQKIPFSDFYLVSQLLDAYLNEKLLNNKLNAWKKVKNFSRKPKHAFSTSSFARNPSKTSRNFDNNFHFVNASIRNSSSYACQPSAGQQSINKVFCNIKYRQKRIEDDDQFEEVVLNRIRDIQDKFSNLKSQKNSSFYQSSQSTLRYRTQGPRQQSCQGIRFGLNARYIPMRQKLRNLEPRVYETEESQLPANDGGQQKKGHDMMFVQTPRIGKRKQSKDLMDKIDLEKSSYSLAEYNKSERFKPRVYYDKIYNTHKKLMDFEEMASEESSESRERVLSHKDMTKNSRKAVRACENVQYDRSEEIYGFHASIGYFKIIPMKNKSLTPKESANHHRVINFNQ